MENKPLYLLLILFFYFSESQAQENFGVKGGLNFTFFKVIEGPFGIEPETEVGFYGGIFADFLIDKRSHIQPELLYIGVGDFRFLNAPIYYKYDIDSNFHVLVGPSLNYFFDFFNRKVKVRADLSVAYDISSQLDVHMKNTLGFEQLAPNSLFLGLAYKL